MLKRYLNRKLEDLRERALFIDHCVEEMVDEIIPFDEDIYQSYLFFGQEIDYKKLKPITSYISEIYKDINVTDEKIFDLEEEINNLDVKLGKIPELLTDQKDKYWGPFANAVVNLEGDREITSKLCQYTLNFQDKAQEFLKDIESYKIIYTELKADYINISGMINSIRD